jgi:hypothetical protein
MKKMSDYKAQITLLKKQNQEAFNKGREEGFIEDKKDSFMLAKEIIRRQRSGGGKGE